MKKCVLKCMALLLAIVLVLPVLPTGVTITASAAAKPSLSLTSKTLVGIGSTFTLNVKNLDTKKVKSAVWTSSNKKVATVASNKGYVTAEGKGTTNIKVKITYTDKKVTTLTCKVAVKIPATAIEITNAQDTDANNNRHVIEVGGEFDFNSVKTPSNASDLITYTIDKTTYATVDKKGIVKGIKPGFVRLTATASLTKAGVSTSAINDIINIEVVDKTARAKNVALTDNTTLTVTFDRPIDASTLIGTDKKLLNNISITAKTNEKGVVANGLGNLTGVLSDDKKTLTITSSKIFNGLYSIHFSSNIKSTDNVALLDYYKEVEFYDKVAPTFKDWSVDDTGLKVTLTFSEPVDFANLAISSVKLVSAGETALPATISTLSTKSNYVKSEDGKSLTIDLSSISSYDYNKTFAVVMAGLKDTAGNYPSGGFITAYVATDTRPKAQARLINIERTGFNTLTATFTRGIKTAGSVQLSNGEWINGVVDATDNKKVNYTLSSTAALLSGNQKVSVGYWDAYNVTTSDTSANVVQDRYINFATDKSIPVITKSELTTDTTNGVETYILTLTYNKDVSLMSATGTFTSRLITANNDIYSNKLLGYKAIVQGKVVTVILESTMFNEIGNYIITIPQGFVHDAYMNLSVENTVQAQKGGSSSTALPAPRDVKQDPKDASIVYVTFANKLDDASAQNVSNYNILGAVVTKAELVDNTTSGATVKLTLLSGSVTVSTLYPVIITGVEGYHNTYTAITRYDTMLFLNENRGPVLTKTEYTHPNTITLTFDENLFGTPSFQAIQSGSSELNVSSSYIDGNKVIIILNTRPVSGAGVQITATQLNTLADAAGNKTNFTTTWLTPVY